jgi:hypothetical protein
MSVAADLKTDKQKKMVKIIGKIEDTSKKKLDVVCGHFGISIEAYVGALIEKSELEKVYKTVLKEQKVEDHDKKEDS